MERREEIKVKPGFEYDHYFPKAKLITITKKKGATVADTILLIPVVVNETLFHTKRFAQEEMQDDTLEKTCKNIWQFVFDHIAYKKDEEGKEQVRSPARAWHDRGNIQGVDCDCYTVFISSILSNLNIKHKLRITKYSEDHFQHIYPIVPIGDGRHITIDCVVKSFDYEEPYTEKKDTNMDLEYLNGVTVSDRGTNRNNDSQDFMGLMGEQEALSELGKIFKRKSSGAGSGGNQSGGQKKGKVKAFLKKGLHVTNRLNPAAATLRAGILAAMKLNFMKIGGQIRYAYLTEDQARQKGLIMDRYFKMKKISEKLDKIFYGAGGKPENLKKAILTGKGNKNKEVPVNGLGYITYENVDGLHEDMRLSQLIGKDMYSSENMNGIEGLGELGEPATAATIAAATTVLTTIAALIKSVGSIVPKKKADGKNEGGGGDSGGGTSSDDSSNNSSASDKTSENSSSTNETDSRSNDTPASKPSNTTNTNTPATTDSSNSSGDGEENNDQKDATKTKSETPSTKPSFWDNNKKWIKPVGIGVGSLGLIALIYQLLKPKAKSALQGTPKKSNGQFKKNLLNGIQTKAKKGGNHPTKRHKPKTKKKVVTLL